MPPGNGLRPDGDDENALVIPISALNHFLFCERRVALIHTEGLFPRNQFTEHGDLVHERVDEPGYRDRRGCRTVRAMPLFSDRLGLSGRADLVEFWPRPGGSEEPRPVDYKRGRASRWINDAVQLCAQALSLEEMLGTSVTQGSIFHASSRRRTPITFDRDLRETTEQAIRELRALLLSGRIPPPVYRPRCHGCSFEPDCLPRQQDDSSDFARYMRELLSAGEEP